MNLLCGFHRFLFWIEAPKTLSGAAHNQVHL